MTITTPSQQNKEILEKFREKYVINHPPTPPYITDEFEVDSIESFILFILEQKDQEKEKALEEQKERIKNALFYGAAKRGFEKSDVENEQGWILSIMENTLEQSFKKATGLEIKEVKEKCPCCDELDVFNNEFCNKCGCKEVFPFKERDK